MSALSILPGHGELSHGARVEKKYSSMLTVGE